MAEPLWYVTVGVPGGEFACKSKTLNVFRAKIGELDELVVADDADETQAGSMDFNYWTRPAAPDLVEWMEAPAGWINGRAKVAGGWTESGSYEYNFPEGGVGASFSMCFVPVAGAAGITIIKEAEDD